jgi:hypothetical protein
MMWQCCSSPAAALLLLLISLGSSLMQGVLGCIIAGNDGSIHKTTLDVSAAPSSTLASASGGHSTTALESRAQSYQFTHSSSVTPQLIHSRVLKSLVLSTAAAFISALIATWQLAS